MDGGGGDGGGAAYNHTRWRMFLGILRCSGVLPTLQSRLVKEKIEFDVNQMNWPLKVVALFPQLLGYSMEKRIAPRGTVIKALIAKGLLGSEPLRFHVSWHIPVKQLVTELLLISEILRKDSNKID
uniref:Uncharacterized protein n=1 Tax=Brassica campestris TaxID=3711 RepID=M4ED07_BRACM